MARDKIHASDTADNAANDRKSSEKTNRFNEMAAAAAIAGHFVDIRNL